MAAFVDGGVEVESRVRSHLDTHHGRFTSERLLARLNQQPSGERLILYLPTGTDDATAASVTIALSGSGQTQTYVMTLSRTISGSPATQSITLSAGKTVGDVIEAIRLLDLGWVVSVTDGQFEEECSTNDTWQSELVATRRVTSAPAINLRATAATSAYGDRDDAVEIAFYEVGPVVLWALEIAGAADGQLRRARNLAEQGIHAV